MEEHSNKFDLEDRTLTFSKAVMRFCSALPKDVVTREIISQLVRAAGSIGANYIEANEALSKKDFVHRIKISAKKPKKQSIGFF